MAWLWWHGGYGLWVTWVVGFVGRLMLVCGFYAGGSCSGGVEQRKRGAWLWAVGFGECTMMEIGLLGVDWPGIVVEGRDWPT
ncbi:hypothetical protein SO802_002788 [Lithocarpus litseifolius]|uniref:Transmembrane protein n=1 Tax=Lithocarpus litseifolius TaxID=425828 RepID=A0AAW2E056_9ROSI